MDDQPQEAKDPSPARSAAAAAKKRYSQTEKGRAVHRAAMRKYLATEAGKQAAARATAKYKAKKKV